MFDATALDRIQVQAKEIDPLKALLVIVAALPYILGWVLAKVVGLVWLVLSWAIAAGQTGWQEARKPKPPSLRSGNVG